MTLKLYNTRARRKQVFEPIDPAAVRMYVCGPTVYDFAHIGNARPIIVFDVLFRLLRHLYGPDHVIYARNITDVDDKINARAAEEGISIRELTERTTAQFHEDIRALGVLTPEDVNEPGKPPRFIEPRATDYVSKPDAAEDMIRMIGRLIERGHAYEAEGHVLFSVATDPDYGKLARRSVDEMRAGARVEVAPYKRDPMDFVLWKPSTVSEPGWDSPWGFGRPGWHLECSAMSAALLGEVFDIHGGGIDLLFPHHENEVAQSTGAYGADIMAKFWMHNGHLQVEGAKMSKSLGNFVTIRDLLKGYNGLAYSGSAIRLAMLETNYRHPIDWTKGRIASARNEIWDYAQFCLKHKFTDRDHFEDLWSKSPVPTEELVDSLCDDLNANGAITLLRRALANAGKVEDKFRADFINNVRFLGLFRNSNFLAYATGAGFINSGTITDDVKERISAIALNLKAFQANDDKIAINESAAELGTLGFRLRQIENGPLKGELQIESTDLHTMDEVNDMIADRNAARKAKNWAEADRIRDDLAAKGIALKDTKNPVTGEIETTWEVAR